MCARPRTHTRQPHPPQHPPLCKEGWAEQRKAMCGTANYLKCSQPREKRKPRVRVTCAQLQKPGAYHDTSAACHNCIAPQCMSPLAETQRKGRGQGCNATKHSICGHNQPTRYKTAERRRDTRPHFMPALHSLYACLIATFSRDVFKSAVCRGGACYNNQPAEPCRQIPQHCSLP